MDSQTVNQSNGSSPLPPATRLRQLIEKPGELLLCPGVYDGFSARIALQVGFDALYMVCPACKASSSGASRLIELQTGAGTTASKLGHADLGICQLHDMRENAEMIANLDSRVPLIVDMDTGYGGEPSPSNPPGLICLSVAGPIMVARSTEQYLRSNVAGFHIEDQVQAKRCGHLQGKELVDTEIFLSRIRAAKAARDKQHSDAVIIARTDALQKYGYEESIKRLRAASEAGADVGFLEGITSKEQARQAVKDLQPFPLLLNMVEHGATPTVSVDEAREMGFRIMIVPFAALAPAYTAIKTAFERLKKTGLTGTGKELTPRKLFQVCGLEDSMRIDAAAGGRSFENGA